jgi:hypothetical protein
VGRRAAAQEKRPNRLGLAQCGQLGAQGVDVSIDQVIFPGRHGKIAVPAVMRTERHMDVGGCWPKPGGER